MRFSSQARWLGAVAVVVMVLFAVEAWADSARSLYKEGKKRLDAGNGEMALLYFRQLLREHPESSYADDAQFLIASYYLETRDYFQADQELRRHLSTYPKSPYVEQVRQMLAGMQVLGLESKALKAMESSEYRVAKVLWEDVLARDPTNEVAARKLAECDRIIERMDYQKRQLEQQKRRIEEESKQIATLLKEARRQREEAERIRAEAQEMDEKTRAKYEAALSEANKLSGELEKRIEYLESDLKLWRDRARKYEARLLQEPDIGPLEGIAAGQESPKIIFEGPETDPYAERDEQQVTGIVLDASPSVVLVGELMNRETNVLKAEVVAAVDLVKPWPKEALHLLKVRIDFTGLTLQDGTIPKIPSKTVYYTLADMDDVDTRNRAYRKKLTIAVDKNTVDSYSVAAYFVRKTNP
jgi:tetratricopeptide (TPR) repeat protein